MRRDPPSFKAADRRGPPPPSATAPPTAAVTPGRVFRLWWPLAASWLLMGAEMPLLVAAVARLPEPEPNLAAFGSVVYPIALIVEGPIIMLLAAATALVSDRPRYLALRRFTWTAALALTAVHAAIAFTPLYDFIADTLVRVPPAAREPGRVGLRWMLPWAGAIAYRRFQQGVLIRHEQSRAVVVGTALRLLAGVTVLTLGLTRTLPLGGIAVGAAALATGVLAEAIYAGWRVRSVVATLPADDEASGTLTASRFLHFYVPLALTPLATLAVQPVSAAALARMPEATRSLASWSAVYGLVFLLRAPGFALQEVTVTLRGRPGGATALRRFAVALAAVTSGLLLLTWMTPLGTVWFGVLLAMPADLTRLGAGALGAAVLLPALAVAQNHLQGALVGAHRTRSVTAAVTAYAATACGGYALAVAFWNGTGLPAALLVLTVAVGVQVFWLRVALRRAP